MAAQASVIDELVVELKLDASKFNAGQKQAVNTLRQFQTQAQNAATATERHASNAVAAVNRLRGEVLSLGAAMIGVKGLSGIGGFIQSTIQGVTETGRLARSLNISVDSLTKWQTALKLGGVSVQGANAALSGLLQTMASIAVEGQTGEAFQWLQTIIPNINDFLNATTGLVKEEKIPELLEAMARGFERINRQGPGMAALFGAKGGIPAEAVQFFVQGPKAVHEMLEKSKELAPITKQMADNAEATSKAWAEAGVAWDGILTKASLFFSGELIKFSKDVKGVADVIKRVGAGNFSDFLPGGTPPTGELGKGGETFNVKSGSGTSTIATRALAAYLAANVQGFNRVTAFNDEHHGGLGRHGRGLALDYTVTGGNYEHQQSADQVRALLKQLGINAFVQAEYKGITPGATGTHVHVQFQSQADADTFRQRAGFDGGGAGNQQNVTNNWHMNVNVKDGKSVDLALQIKSAMMTTPWSDIANNANGGAQ